MQTVFPQFLPSSRWTPAPVRTLPDWGGAPFVSIDTETRDPHLLDLGIGVRRGGFVCGISFSTGEKSWYLPVRHADGNLPYQEVSNYLRYQALRFTGSLVGANLSYDLDYLAEMGVVFDKAAFCDIQVAESLLDEWRPSFSLESLAGYYKLTGKDEGPLKEAAALHGVMNPKSIMDEYPSHVVAPYAMWDAELTLRIYERQRPGLDRLEAAWRQEQQLLRVLLDMRRRGIRIDMSALGRVAETAEIRIKEQIARLRTLTLLTFSPADFIKAGPVANAIMRDRGIECPRSAKTGKPVADKKWLASIDSPAAACILEARKWITLQNLFIASLQRHHVNGRIHPTYRQCRSSAKWDAEESGAAFGRISCTNPNLQQTPGKEEIGKLCRRVYLPDHGGQWISADYSQQEMRLAVHCAVNAKCTGAEKFAAAWKADATMDTYQKIADMCEIPRAAAKVITLGVMYGMGGAKMCRTLGLPVSSAIIRGVNREVAGPDGKRLLRRYYENFPFLKQLSRFFTDLATNFGHVKTLGGRTCRFEKVAGVVIETHKALNRVIQGSASDQTKQALIQCHAAGLTILTTLHDEIDFSGGAADAAKAKSIMENVIPLEVPVVAETSMGPTWSDTL